ncbi:MAG: redoxin domain-containing protein, partial [Terriglobia bacterium]
VILLVGTLFCCPMFCSEGPMSAAAVLERVTETYRNLKSCHVTAERDIETSMPRLGSISTGAIRARVDLIWVKPSEVRLEVKEANRDLLTVSNGSASWQYVSDLREYTHDQGALMGGDGSAESDTYSPDLVAEMEDTIIFRYNDLAQYRQYARLEKEAKLKFEGNGRLCYVVELKVPNQGNHKLWIDEANFLVLRHEEDSKRIKNSIPLLLRAVLEVTHVDPDFHPGPATFEFSPPAGAKEVETFDPPGTKPRLLGQVAPEFILRTVDGERVALNDLRGKVVVLDFWATWCPPCRQELPAINKINQEFQQQGLVVLGIDAEDAYTVNHFLKKNGYDFPTLMDDNRSVSRAYAVRLIPNLIIINREGIVVAHLNGLQSEQRLVAALNTVGLKSAQN